MYQKLTLTGNLGNDPELRYLPDGTAVCNFSMAVNRKYNTKAGETVQETTWFRVTAWGKMGENCNQYLHKGSLVLVDGELTADKDTGGPRTFTRNDGTVGASFEVKANQVQFLSKNEEDYQREKQNQQAEEDELFDEEFNI